MQTNPSFYERVINASLYSEFRDYYDLESKAPRGWETKIARLFDPIFSTLSSTYRERKADLSHRLMMMAEAKQKFDHVRRATEPLLTRQEEKTADPQADVTTGITSEPMSPRSSALDQGDVIIDMPKDEKIEALENEDIFDKKELYAYLKHLNLHYQKEAKIEDPMVKMINDNPEVPVSTLDLSTFKQLEDFLTKHGREITALNLLFIDLDDTQFERLMKLCPSLEHLSFGSNASNFKGDTLTSLKGMPLRTLDLSHHPDLTDDKLEVLKELPLESVKFNGSEKLTDKTLEFLKGKPLHTVQFYWSKQLTDRGLENLKGTPLKEVFFGGCPQLTDRALDNFKGMALRSVSFADTQVTDQGLKIFQGMPLEYIDFEECPNLSKDALAEFKKSVRHHGSPEI